MAVKRKFEFLEDIATADAAYESFGESLEELLQNAAAGLFATMVELEKIERKLSREVTAEGDDREDLLYSWLAELVYLKDVHSELYSEFEVTVNNEGTLRLKANVAGASIASLTEHTSCDVKAVTYHRLEIIETDEGLKATVVLDL